MGFLLYADSKFFIAVSQLCYSTLTATNLAALLVGRLELYSDSGIERSQSVFIVKDLLNEKGNEVWTIHPDASVREALEIMAEKRIGALLVVEGDVPVGVFSERDLARRIIRAKEAPLDQPLKRFMTSPVITVTPLQSAEECMGLMTNKHVRHLPVMENNRLIGLISIGDVVKAMITSKEKTIQKLEDYIAGVDYAR
jgi:CBS domain-containing protein